MQVEQRVQNKDDAESWLLQRWICKYYAEAGQQPVYLTSGF